MKTLRVAFLGMMALSLACGGDDNGSGDGGEDATLDTTIPKDAPVDSPVDASGDAKPGDAGADVVANDASDGGTTDAATDAAGDAATDASDAGDCDGGCVLFSYACKGTGITPCTCLSLSISDPTPVCDAGMVNCFKDPCVGKTATCDTNMCVVK